MRKYLLALVMIALAQNLPADTLELKNGTILSGKFEGGTATTLRFKNDSGEQNVDISQVVTLTFTSNSNTAPVPGGNAIPTPTGRAPAATVTIPAGTTLLVRMMDGVSSRSAPGANFTTRLETDLMAGDTVAVKAGTTVYGKVQNSSEAGRATGRSALDLRLTGLAPGGKTVPIVTSSYAEAGEASVKKAGRGAAAGAGIGAIAGDAGKGAAIGATAGALRKGQTLTIPPGALLEFQLTQPTTVNVGASQ